MKLFSYTYENHPCSRAADDLSRAMVVIVTLLMIRDLSWMPQ